MIAADDADEALGQQGPVRYSAGSRPAGDRQVAGAVAQRDPVVDYARVAGGGDARRLAAEQAIDLGAEDERGVVGGEDGERPLEGARREGCRGVEDASGLFAMVRTQPQPLARGVGNGRRPDRTKQRIAETGPIRARAWLVAGVLRPRRRPAVTLPSCSRASRASRLRSRASMARNDYLPGLRGSRRMTSRTRHLAPPSIVRHVPTGGCRCPGCPNESRLATSSR